MRPLKRDCGLLGIVGATVVADPGKKKVTLCPMMTGRGTGPRAFIACLWAKVGAMVGNFMTLSPGGGAARLAVGG